MIPLNVFPCIEEKILGSWSWEFNYYSGDRTIMLYKLRHIERISGLFEGRSYFD